MTWSDRSHLPLPALLALVLFGCATAEPPKQAHLEASAAVRAAEELVEPEAPMPQAELYLTKAQDHLRAAEILLEKSNYEGAHLHYERAKADAETSIALARAHRAEKEAADAEARLDVVGGGGR